MSSFKQYPMAMKHPGHKPAVISQDQIVNGRYVKSAAGSPEKFPPVFVNNEDQEQQYAALGYVPNGVSDPEAYRRAMTGNDEPVNHKHRDYPRWMYQQHDDGDHEVLVGYDPVMVRGVLVHSEQERSALRGEWFETPMQAAEAHLTAPDESAKRKQSSKAA